MALAVALRSLAAALPCLAISLAWMPASAQGPVQTGGPATLLELTDTALIARAWETLFPDSVPPPGEFQALIPPGPELSSGRMESATVHILHNGTEAGHMDRGAWDVLAAQAGRGRESWAEAMEGPDKSDVPILWQAMRWDAASMLARLDWPYGFLVGMGSGIASIRGSKPQFQRDIDFAWDQRLFGHFLLGASLHRSQYGGGLTRLGANVLDTLDGSAPSLERIPFQTDAYWWWSVSAGVPGLKYTLNLASRPLPQYYWLETRASPAIRYQTRGRLIRQWIDSSGMDMPGNFAQTVEARFGILRYSMHWDGDAYRAPVQAAGVGDIHALFGQWGADLIFAADLLATRVWVDIPDATLDLMVPEAWPTRFRVAFLHLEFAYRNTKNFNLGISVRLRIENPIMTKPGA